MKEREDSCLREIERATIILGLGENLRKFRGLGERKVRREESLLRELWWGERESFSFGFSAWDQVEDKTAQVNPMLHYPVLAGTALLMTPTLLSNCACGVDLSNP
jgi:hypothetical protein